MTPPTAMDGMLGGLDRAAVEALALASEKVQRQLAGAEPRKVIVVPDRLVNIVA